MARRKARWRHAGCANVRDWVLQMTLKKLSHFMHRQPKLNIREPLNYKDLYGNTTTFSTAKCNDRYT